MRRRPDTPEIKTEVEGLVARLREKRTGVVWIEEMLPRPELIAVLAASASSCAPRSTSPWASSTSRPWPWACRSSALPPAASQTSSSTARPACWYPSNRSRTVPAPPIDPARFEADLAECLTTLVTDTEAAKAMGQAARRRVEEHFAWEAIAQRTMDVYNWVLAQG